MTRSIHCPQCGSERLYKDGLRYLKDGSTVQRWLCRNCGYRFSESKNKKNHVCSADRNIWKIAPLRLKISPDLSYGCQVGAAPSPRRVKNLAEVVNPSKSGHAGASKLDEAIIKGKIVEFIAWQQKEGYRESTIRGRLGIIKTLAKNCGPNLLNPDAVKEFLAKLKTSDGYKANIVVAYTAFLAMQGLTWKPPRYERRDRTPFIPLESELDQLIAAAGRTLAKFLQGLKETGADPGELIAIEWTDINPQARTITLNHPVKGHKARILNVSNDYIAMLNTLPRTSIRVFPGTLRTYMRSFYNLRKRMAKQFANPRFMKIVFTTFRHWKATMEYHKTKDILHVMKLLGHNSLKTTLIYIDLEKAIFNTKNDEFTVRVADNLEEACKLLEVGFEYITDMDGKKLFRKRK